MPEFEEPIVKPKSLRERLGENLNTGLRRSEYLYGAAKALKNPVRAVVFSSGVSMKPRYY